MLNSFYVYLAGSRTSLFLVNFTELKSTDFSSGELLRHIGEIWCFVLRLRDLGDTNWQSKPNSMTRTCIKASSLSTLILIGQLPLAGASSSFARFKQVCFVYSFPTGRYIFNNHQTSMEGTYVAYPINRKQEEIRLLTILPENLDRGIKGSFTTASLLDNPAYIALSYAWGDPP